MKPSWQLVLAEADRLAKGGARPHLYARDMYGSAMLDVAASAAQTGESVASALARLWSANDTRIATLHKAYESAPLLPKVGKHADIAEVMNSHARLHQKRGETYEQAYDRLLVTDQTMRKLFDLHSGAVA